jgi:hypothetical protein
VLLSSALLLAGLCGSASAKRHPLIGKDKRIHACYRVKGKPKGALRAVRSRRTRCKRGERKVAWSVATAPAALGSTGSQGGAGGDGAAGAGEAVLKAQVGALVQRVEALEGVIASLCSQTGALAAQVNLVQDVVAGLGLEPALELIGLLEIPALPTPLALDEFGCPTS